MGGCHQKISNEKNEEEKLLDNFVGIWKTFQSFTRGYSSSPPRWYYLNDSITITFFSDRTLAWEVEETSTHMNHSRRNGIEETYTEYSYSGYYRILSGKLVILLNGVTIYEYIFTNNSQNLTLIPFFDIPDLRTWKDYLRMNLSRYIDESHVITEKQNVNTNQLHEFYGTWITQLTNTKDSGNFIDHYNDSILITFYPNSFFSSMVNGTGISRWLDSPSSEWSKYNRSYPVSGYYEIKGKKLALTAASIGIFFFIFSNNSHTLSLVPFYCKNTPSRRLPFDIDSQTLILKKQSESNQQNVEEQNLDDKTLDMFVGTWKRSNVVNDSQYYIKNNYTITFFSEQFILIIYNSTTEHKEIQLTTNNSFAYQGFYEIKAGKLVITSFCVFIFNFSFSNNSSILTLRSLFPVQSFLNGFNEDIQIFIKQ